MKILAWWSSVASDWRRGDRCLRELLPTVPCVVRRPAGQGGWHFNFKEGEDLWWFVPAPGWIGLIWSHIHYWFASTKIVFNHNLKFPCHWNVNGENQPLSSHIVLTILVASRAVLIPWLLSGLTWRGFVAMWQRTTFRIEPTWTKPSLIFVALWNLGKREESGIFFAEK